MDSERTKAGAFERSTDMNGDSFEIHSSVLALEPIPPPSNSTPSVLSMDESMEDNEEKRVSYFLQCFSNVPRRTDRRRCGEDNVDEDSIASIEVDSGNHNEDTIHRQDDESEGEFETILVDQDNDETTIVVAPSFMSDNTILKHLRSTLYGTGHRSSDHSSTDGTDEASTDSIQDEEREGMEDHSSGQLQYSRKKCRHDPMVVLFFKFFEFAQSERLKKPYAAPYFILHLFSHLSNIRSDLEWAQDAAYRRQTGKPYVAWADYFAKDRFHPWFTYVMIVIISFTMVWVFYENDWKAEPMRTNPSFGPSQDVLLKVGAMKGQLLVEEGKWWLLVTPIFLHAGLIHFVLNMGLFFFLCRNIERNHGWLHTALLFLSSGIVGNMFSAFFQPTLVCVGSSGGIYGLLGACLGDIVLNSRFFFFVLEERAQKETLQRQRQRLQRKLKRKIKHKGQSGVRESDEEEGKGKMLREQSAGDLIVRACDAVTIQKRRRWVRFWCYVSLAIDLLINYAFGLLPFVDNFAHMGGLFFGFFVSLSSLRLLSASPFDYRKKEHKNAVRKWCDRLRIFALRCGGGLSAFCLVGVAIFFLRRSDGTNSPCPRCRYVSCMPMPKPWKPNDPSNWWTCDGCDGVEGYVYWQGTGVDEIFATADIFCPAGDIVRVNVAEMRYNEMEQARKAFPDLCRAHCSED